ncbi:hypothetical protein Dda_5840 [Drechslerella dactyloides]|uniref:Major facilitator superfamily (MFS) profile domain-containing protein n=1 Tax=Drechslerella dactyloides TaxID=74499 RepID=A0AAD6IWM7_DREDA|nr:hypothetical protein Dda_5840 [Drechslerella dactyloides]
MPDNNNRLASLVQLLFIRRVERRQAGKLHVLLDGKVASGPWMPRAGLVDAAIGAGRDEADDVVLVEDLDLGGRSVVAWPGQRAAAEAAKGGSLRDQTRPGRQQPMRDRDPDWQELKRRSYGRTGTSGADVGGPAGWLGALQAAERWMGGWMDGIDEGSRPSSPPRSRSPSGPIIALIQTAADRRATMKDITPFLLFNILIISLGSLLFGYHIAELNAPEDVISCRKNGVSLDLSLRPCIPMSPQTYGFVTSIFSVGGLGGAITAGSVADKYGRKRAALFYSAGFIIGPIFMAFASDVTTLSIGRLISGLSAGSSVVIAPLYIHNVAPAEFAGLFGASTQVIVNFGIIVAQLLGLFLSNIPFWRLILAIGGFIGLAQAILLPFCVESPKWLASVGKTGLARRSLAKLRGRNDVDDEITVYSAIGVDDDDDPFSHEDEGTVSQRLLDSPTAEATIHKKVTLYEFLTDPARRRQLTAIVGIMLAQQFMGINAIIMYGVGILKVIIPSGATLINVCVSLLNLLVTAGAARYIDQVGRKSLLLASIAGMGVFSALLGIGIIFKIQVLSGVATLLFVASFAIGLGPLPFMIASELVEHDAVGAAQSIGLTTNWLATFAVAAGFPTLREVVGDGEVFFIFAALGIVFFWFVLQAIPETKGRTVDEVWGHTRRVD